MSIKEKEEISFTLEVKNEIYCQRYYRGKNKEAFALGFIKYAYKFDKDEISFHSENRSLARLFSDLIYELIQVQGTITTKEIQHNNGNNVYVVKVDDPSDRTLIVEYFSGLHHLVYEKTSAFLGGVFLSCCRMGNPEKGYHLEFSLKDEIRINELSEILDNMSIKHGKTTRRHSHLIYIKDSSIIEDILAIVGANQSVFKLIDVKIIKEIRNKVNRQTNCETANIGKIINASAEQLEAINKIDALIGLSTLDEDIQEIAEIRINNPEMSLREIGEATTVPLSRSAVNNRIQKILAIAKNLA